MLGIIHLQQATDDIGLAEQPLQALLGHFAGEESARSGREGGAPALHRRDVAMAAEQPERAHARGVDPNHRRLGAQQLERGLKAASSAWPSGEMTKRAASWIWQSVAADGGNRSSGAGHQLAHSESGTAAGPITIRYRRFAQGDWSGGRGQGELTVLGSPPIPVWCGRVRRRPARVHPSPLARR